MDASLGEVNLRSRTRPRPLISPAEVPPAPETPSPTPMARLVFGQAPPAQQYPIPPAAVDTPDAPAASAPPVPTVPTWGVRAAATSVPEPVPQPTFSVRRGLSKLTVDDRGLRVRSVFACTRVPWEEISGFVPRFDPRRTGPDARGVLVALTYDGELPLAATRSRIDRLRELHEIFDAYHLRWRSTPRP